MKAITIRQPWAWAIINAGKDIENRDWNTHFRGRVAIHAAKGMTKGQYERGYRFIKGIKPRIKIPTYEDLERGEIIGTVEIVSCVQDSSSPWFFGE
jgi:ASCH domain-containing protein